MLKEEEGFSQYKVLIQEFSFSDASFASIIPPAEPSWLGDIKIVPLWELTAGLSPGGYREESAICAVTGAVTCQIRRKY